jgi:hypothetical protein
VQVDARRVTESAAADDTIRMRLEFRPARDRDVFWCQDGAEGHDLVVWLDPPIGWRVDRRRLEIERTARGAADEPRRVEFALRSRRGASGAAPLAGYAVYHVREGTASSCLERRQELSIPLGEPARGMGYRGPGSAP